MIFTLGLAYTRTEINAQLGGNLQTYLPVKAGVVVASCLRLDLNPGLNRDSRPPDRQAVSGGGAGSGNRADGAPRLAGRQPHPKLFAMTA